MLREIVVIGLGPGSPDALSLGALRALRSLSEASAPLVARTRRHPTVAWLESREGVRFTDSYDRLYDGAPTFDDLYAAIAADLLGRDAPVVGYAVPGHPSYGERAVELLRATAPGRGVAVRLVGSGSYLDAVLETEPSPRAPYRVLDALDLIRRPAPYAPETEPLDPGALHVIYQVYDDVIASELKLALLEMLPPDAPVTIVAAAGVAGEERRVTRPLAELDRPGARFDHLTTLLVPPLARPELFAGMQGLLTIMARLRDPDGGCPWDREQTPQSLRKFLLEEAYEVIDAIDDADMPSYVEELGDLLLQVVFHAQLAREAGEFTFRDAVAAVTAKLVRRHPHVFGDAEGIRTADQVLANWAAIKRGEPGYEARTSLLDGVPRSMPALLRAQEISRRAAKAGFEWPDIGGVFDKLDEEVAELREAIALGDAAAVEAELGDLLFTAVNLCRFRQVSAEEALTKMLQRFSRRFRRIEEHAAGRGLSVSDLTPAEMESVWRDAKRE